MTYTNDDLRQIIAEQGGKWDAGMMAQAWLAERELRGHCNLCGGEVDLSKATNPTVSLGAGNRAKSNRDWREVVGNCTIEGPKEDVSHLLHIIYKDGP